MKPSQQTEKEPINVASPIVSNEDQTGKPDSVNIRHWDEWTKGSGVNPEIVSLNVRSLSDAGTIARTLGWRKYAGSEGWLVKSAKLDRPAGSRFKDEMLCFKPDSRFVMTDGKEVKYLNPKKGTAKQDVIFLEMPQEDYWKQIEADPTRPIVIVEGAKKAAALLSIGIPTIALAGVQSWGSKSDCSNNQPKKEVKERELYEGLSRMAKGERKFIILFDADFRGNASVRYALRDLGTNLELAGAYVYVAEIPEDSDTKGIDDFLVANGMEPTQALFTDAQKFARWMEKWFASKDEDKKQNPPHSEAASLVADKLRGLVAFRQSKDSFYAYQPAKGFWKMMSKVERFGFFADQLTEDICPKGTTKTYVEGIITYLESILMIPDWETPKGLINFKNGVLDIDSGELLKHSPEFKFLDAPTHDYDPEASCPKIQAYLEEALEGNQDAIRVLRAYWRAILTRSYDLQKFLEIDGEGGTGKSVLLSLSSALVGKAQTGETTLETLEGNKYAMFGLVDYPLILIRDSEEYVGTAPTLKKMTGCDEIPLEAKFLQPEGKGALFQGMVMIASNYPIRFASDNSAFFRRRLIIQMNRKVSEDKTDPKFAEKLLQEVSGLINWVLEVSYEEMCNILLRTSKYAPQVYLWSRQQVAQTNPVAHWADLFLVQDEAARTQVGTAKKDDFGKLLHTEEWLYPAYLQFCSEAGIHKPVSLVKFGETLKSLFEAQLKLEGVKLIKPKNKSTFTGIRLRKDFDTAPALISRSDEDDEDSQRADRLIAESSKPEVPTGTEEAEARKLFQRFAAATYGTSDRGGSDRFAMKAAIEALNEVAGVSTLTAYTVSDLIEKDKRIQDFYNEILEAEGL